MIHIGKKKKRIVKGLNYRKCMIHIVRDVLN